MNLLQDIIRAVRNIRSKFSIQEKQPLKIVVSVPDDSVTDTLRAHQRILHDFGYIEEIELGIGLLKPPLSATDVIGKVQVFVPLAGVMDIDAERDRLIKRIEKAETRLNALLTKLANRDFLERAPADVVARGKERRDEIEDQITKLRTSLAELEENA